MINHPEQEFFSIKEVAVIFGCHPITIRRALKRQFLVAIRLGSGKRSPYRISKKSLEKIHDLILQELSKKALK